MNTTFLLVSLIVLAIAIGGWVLFYNMQYTGRIWELAGLTVGVFGSLATIVMTVLGFTAPLGTTIITDTADFTVEKTPYRTILKAFNREVTFTDAYTVVNTDRIERARLIAPTNAWGITLDMQTKLVPLFKEAK